MRASWCWATATSTGSTPTGRWCRRSTTPARVLPPDVEGSGAHDLGRNGSYLVLRQLEQDVPAFWRFADRSAGEDRIRLAAKMVGRWPSGAPLVLVPDADDPDIERDRLNAFRYHRDDPLARRCPVASHIRRTNPRESLDPDPGSSGSLAVGKHHRIMRRGRSYGTRLTIDQALAGGDGRAARPLLHVPEHQRRHASSSSSSRRGRIAPSSRGSTTSPIRCWRRAGRSRCRPIRCGTG